MSGQAEKFTCAYCGGGVKFDCEYSYPPCIPATTYYRHFCKYCGMQSKGFETRELAEAHARGHLEAMIERLAIVKKFVKIYKDDEGWVVQTFSEPNTLDDWLKPSLRAAAEAALKEVEK